MTVAMSGVFSGIDTQALVAKLMEANRRPVVMLENMKSKLESQRDAFGSVETLLSDLQGKLTALRGLSNIRAVTASSSDESVATVRASGAANEGSHTITVNQLAKAEREVHDGVATTDEALDPAAGTFVYTYGAGDAAVTRTIQTTATTTLQDLVNLINNDANNPGVTASILEYEVDETHVYHLVLGGTTTGADSTIEIDAATTLAGFDASVFTQTQSAQDAEVKVDGYPSGADEWITRSSNSISDVIPGVTVVLRAAGSTDLVLARDTEELNTQLEDVKTAYNDLLAKVAELTGYDDTAEQGGLLQGNLVLSTLMREIRTALTGAQPGFDSGSDTFTLADEIGLKFEGSSSYQFGKDTMSFDSTTFEAAAAADYQAVLALIGADGSGASDSDYIQFLDAHSETQAGLYDVQVAFDTSTGEITSAQIRLDGETTWRDMGFEAGSNVIVGAEDGPEKWLQLAAVWDGQDDGGGTRTQTAQVRMRRGIAAALGEAIGNMLDSETGSFTIEANRFDSQISSLTDNIETKDRYLELRQEALKARFARLENILAEMDAQRASFQALMGSLFSSSSSG